jgi:soluble lytic murein transglycosylase-like protein
MIGRARIAGLTWVGVCLALPVHAAIWESIDQHGTRSLTSDAYDATYRLLIGDDVPAKEAAPTNIEMPGQQAESPATAARHAALAPIIDEIARRHQIDPALVRAIAYVESRFRTDAVSRKGAMGLMQVMPATMRRYRSGDTTTAADNIEVGARFFKNLLARFDGNVALALAAYNAGEGAVARSRQRIPPYRETMLYVPEVLLRYESYKRRDAPQWR